ncbi:MAG: hypothetical protein K0R78_909 [Pelosinus sp.]|jgi:hypothetical protein|nr:hypothetical protein [Pelosinus sp.]
MLCLLPLLTLRRAIIADFSKPMTTSTAHKITVVNCFQGKIAKSENLSALCIDNRM